MPASPVPRRVRFESDDVDPVKMLIRTNADPPVLVPGTVIEVEVGARWNKTKTGETERVPGHWVRCEVVRESSKELLVRLAQ